MTTELAEMQFELLPSLAAESGEVFGIGAGVSVDEEGFLPGDDEWETENQSNPRRGGMVFGRDTLNGPTWGWNLHVNQKNVATAVEALERFKTAWRAEGIRDEPGAVIPIRYRLNGRVRRVFGRPYRFSAPPSNRILGGYVPITVDFQTESGYTYDDVEQSVSMNLHVGSDGGFTFPLTFPVTTLPPGGGATQAVVGGTAPAYPVVRFDGPITNPVLETGEWTISLAMNIPAGQYVEVDTRPWALTVLLNGTASVAGALGRRQYLDRMKLRPGRHELSLSGSSGSSAASCTVTWANTWNSY